MKIAAAAMLFLLSGAVIEAQTAGDILASSCGPLDQRYDVKKVKDGRPPVPSSEQALVYFVQTQPRGCFGCSEVMRVGLDGSWAGATRPGSFLPLLVSAGHHHVCSNWQDGNGKLETTTELTTFVAEPGKVYYFRTRVIPLTGYTVQDVTLESLSQDEGRLLVVSYSMSKSQPSK